MPTQPMHRPLFVSIHAPTRGATPHFHLLLYFQSGFNPRPHARGDLFHSAPSLSYPCFNPRPHARGDFITISASVMFSMFQSTPPRDGRPPSWYCLFTAACFNPRPHARGDGKASFFPSLFAGFNPRPHARGDGRVQCTL